MSQKTFFNWKVYLGSSFLCLLFFMGYLFSTNSWNQNIFIYLNNSPSQQINTRNIASVKKQTKSLNFKDSQQKQIISSAQFINKKDIIEYYLGHLLVTSSHAGWVLACQKYHTVDMVFLASEISFNGDTAQMILQAPCLFKHNQPLKIGPFSIPKKDILKASVNKELFKSKNSILFFNHITAYWPKKWTLYKIRFFNDIKSEDLILSFTSKKEEDYVSFLLE